jgi:hypothetical protein
MGSDEAALVRLWREKRGEAKPEDLSGNLIVPLGAATEELNRSWYERNTGRRVRDVQRRIRHSAIAWMVATLDGIVEGTEAVFTNADKGGDRDSHGPTLSQRPRVGGKEILALCAIRRSPHLALAEPPRPRSRLSASSI